MTTYIVTYDLRGRRDYAPLYEEIKSTRNWAKITESTWAVVTEESAKNLRDRLRTVMDEDDRLFVVKSGVEGAWRNVICNNEWLKKWL